MSLTETILVAIDFSEDSEAAVLWASRMAERIDARLILLHVIHDPAESPGFYSTAKSEQPQTMQDVAKTMMAEFIATMLETQPDNDRLRSAETRLVTGLPPGRIVECAKLMEAKLVVVGSRGMTGLPHLMLGSVAERVVEMSALPVVVVKAEKSYKKSKKEKRKEKKMKKELKKKMQQDNLTQSDE